MHVLYSYFESLLNMLKYKKSENDLFVSFRIVQSRAL